ncbi:MAG: hypothetical protein KJZ54_02185 [Phycisphaerales bacterium]|nr:hypothetical protein [Phycisphaerales bacterium]
MRKTKPQVFQTAAEVERSMFPALHAWSKKRLTDAPAIGTGLASDFGHRAAVLGGKRPRQSHKRGK